MMKALIAVLVVVLLVLPMLAGIGRLRRLPPPGRGPKQD
jgi:hypothetical protein